RWRNREYVILRRRADVRNPRDLRTMQRVHSENHKEPRWTRYAESPRHRLKELTVTQTRIRKFAPKVTTAWLLDFAPANENHVIIFQCFAKCRTRHCFKFTLPPSCAPIRMIDHNRL